MLEMAINNVEMGSELDRVHILTCCDACVFYFLCRLSLINIFNFSTLDLYKTQIDVI